MIGPPRGLALFLAVLSILLLSAAFLTHWNVDSSGLLKQRLVVNSAVANFGKIRMGREGTAQVRITNRSSDNVQVIGAYEGCRPGACIQLQGGRMPFSVPAGQTVNLSILVRPTAVGQFKALFPIYTDAPGQSELVICVEGEIID